MKRFFPRKKGWPPSFLASIIAPARTQKKLFSTMNVTIQISDEAYKALMSGNGRLRGSLGMVSPTEGNFNAYRRDTPKPGNKYIKLPHGRASVGNSHVRLTLRIGLDEADIAPADAIMDESRMASDFVDKVFDGQEF